MTKNLYDTASEFVSDNLRSVIAQREMFLNYDINMENIILDYRVNKEWRWMVILINWVKCYISV